MLEIFFFNLFSLQNISQKNINELNIFNAKIYSFNNNNLYIYFFTVLHILIFAGKHSSFSTFLFASCMKLSVSLNQSAFRNQLKTIRLEFLN